MRCDFVKLDGAQCRCSAIRGLTKCLFHCEHDARKEIVERPLTKDEKIIILSREIRSAQKIKNRVQRSYEVRALMAMLNQLQDEPETENNLTLDPVEKVVKEWKKDSQIS
jgi:hypothetical protein